MKLFEFPKVSSSIGLSNSAVNLSKINKETKKGKIKSCVFLQGAMQSKMNILSSGRLAKQKQNEVHGRIFFLELFLYYVITVASIVHRDANTARVQK